MALLSRISIRLLFIILVSVSIFSLDKVHIYAADGDPCTVDADNPAPYGTCTGNNEICLATGCWSRNGVIGPAGALATQEAMDYWYKQNAESVRKDVYLTETESMNSNKAIYSFMGPTAQWITDTVLPLPDEYAQIAGIPSNSSAVSQLAGGIVTMSVYQPAKTAVYLADLGKQAGIYNPVYAQDGTGFSALAPVLKVWKAFRNMAYLAFVVIFVVIGFMIMFRSKVSQQAVISIQLALPQIIITLLLITFSYAIASLMIDLIYLLIYLIIAVFETFGIIQTSKVTDVQNMILGRNVIGIAISHLITPNDAAGAAAKAVTNAVMGIVEGGLSGVLGFGTNVLMYLIFAIAILISVFKLFFQLLISYVGLIVSTIFAPILLLFNAVPGSQSFSKWLKGIFANAIVFPVTALMLLVSAALVGEADFGISSDIGYNSGRSDWNKVALPLVGGGMDTNAIVGIIAIGFLMMMPKVVELVQKALGVEGGLGGMMGAIMEPINAPFSPFKKFGGAVAGGVATTAGSRIAAGAESAVKNSRPARAISSWRTARNEARLARQQGIPTPTPNVDRVDNTAGDVDA